AVTRGPQVFALGSVARNFTAAAVRSDPSHPEDVVRLDLRHPGAVQRLTDVNDDVLANKRLGAVEEVWYASSGGARVQGWAVKPPGFDPARRYPLVLSIHGGPFAMYDVGFSYAFQNFAANGYLVLYTNPRGSTGYGDAFAAAIERDYPGPDYDDLMAGVDTLVRRGYVDTTRLYVTGCSGGGGGALPGDRLDQHGGRDRHPVLHPQLLPPAVLGAARRVARALLLDVRGARDHADPAHDGRAGPAHADRPDGGVLRGPEAARRGDRDAPLQRRVSRHRRQAVELDADAALYAELVRAAPAGRAGGGGCRGGGG